MNFQQFKEEYEKLKLKYPRVPSHLFQCENADYGDYMFKCSNVYFCFENAECQDIIYIFDSFKAVNCCDGDYVIESQNCYECVDVMNVNNCTYLNFCDHMYDSHFCWDCSNVNNLFGCVHLKYKEYCIFNKQYTKEEYEKKVKELLQRPAKENLKEMERIAMKFPVTQTRTDHVENCDYGNQVFFSKNMYLCFDASHSENCAYVYDGHYNKSSYDMTQSHHSELSYECTDCSELNNCHNMDYCEVVYDSGFCDNCQNSNHLLGCTSLKDKEYCILNKQYTKEEYEKQAKEIMDSYRQRS